jgi:hypothetical protein
MIISVIMHIAMDVLLGQLRYTRQHLKGPYLIFQRLKRRAKETGQSLNKVLRITYSTNIRSDEFIELMLEWGRKEYVGPSCRVYAGLVFVGRNRYPL